MNLFHPSQQRLESILTAFPSQVEKHPVQGSDKEHSTENDEEERNEGKEENVDNRQNIFDVEIEVAKIVRIWTVEVSEEVKVLRD